MAVLLAAAALLAALPAPALAAPDAPPARAGAILLEWVQGLLAHLGLAPEGWGGAPDGPRAAGLPLGDEMDPNGIAGADAFDGTAIFGSRPLGDEMDPNG